MNGCAMPHPQQPAPTPHALRSALLRWVIAALLNGALLTVLVAWGLVYPDVDWYPSVVNDDSMRTANFRVVDRKRWPGRIEIVWLHTRQPEFRADVTMPVWYDVDRWSLLHHPSAAGSEVVVRERGTGWPAIALHCFWTSPINRTYDIDLQIHGGLQTRELTIGRDGIGLPAIYDPLRVVPQALPYVVWWPGFLFDLLVFGCAATFLSLVRMAPLLRHRFGSARHLAQCWNCRQPLPSHDGVCSECGLTGGRWATRCAVVLRRSASFLFVTAAAWFVVCLLVFVVACLLREKYLEPIHIAASNGDVADLGRLLDTGVDVDHPVAAGPWYTIGCTPLMLAARAGQLEAVELLLQRGASLTVADRHTGCDALCHAAASHQAAVVTLLCEAGADANSRRASKSMLSKLTPLGLALYEGASDEVIRALIAAGADVSLPIYPPSDQDDLRVWIYPLYRAVSASDVAVVRTLLEAGASPWGPEEHSDEFVRAILNRACSRNADVLRALIEHGISIPTGASDSNSMVWMLAEAAQTNDPETLQILLDAGVSVNAVTEWGHTALVYCIVISEPDPKGDLINDEPAYVDRYIAHDVAVERLLQAGIDITYRDSMGLTARDHARIGLREATDPAAIERLQRIIRLLEE